VRLQQKPRMGVSVRCDQVTPIPTDRVNGKLERHMNLLVEIQGEQARQRERLTRGAWRRRASGKHLRLP